MVDKFQARNMIKTIHQFLFGISKEKFQEEVKKDDEKARKLLDDLEDEPVDLLGDKDGIPQV